MGNLVPTVFRTAAVMRARPPESSSRDRIFRAVCSIHASHREPNYCTPWEDIDSYASHGSGFVIADPRDPENARLVLTNAHCVDFATSIRVQRYNFDRAVPATLVRLNRGCDLAILAVDDPAFWRDESDSDSGQTELCPVLMLGKLPDLQDPVRVVGYPEFGTELCVTQGVVSRIQLQRYAHSELDLLAVQTTAIINAGSSGGPVLNDRNDVIGIAFQGIHNIGEIIPNCVFERFLEFNDGHKDGEVVCVAGIQFSCQKLTNMAMTSFLKLDQLEENSCTGVYVTTVGFGSIADKLRVGDVIVEIEGVNIGNGGTFLLGSHRVGYDHLITSHAVGDIVAVGIVRDGERLDVEWELESADSSFLVPENDKMTVKGKKPDFLVVGGMVMVTLSQNSSTALKNMFGDGDFVNHMLEQYSFGVKENERQERVVVSKILPNDIIEGYENLCSSLVETFNGKRVNCLMDMVEELKACTDDYLRIQFSVPVFDAVSFVVLDRRKLVEEEAQIFEEYHIPFRSRINGEVENSPLPPPGCICGGLQTPLVRSSDEAEKKEQSYGSGTEGSAVDSSSLSSEKKRIRLPKDAVLCSWSCHVRCSLM